VVFGCCLIFLLRRKGFPRSRLVPNIARAWVNGCHRGRNISASVQFGAVLLAHVSGGERRQATSNIK